ncbi:porin [Caballeronia mineralivorans]|uniref:porin n=1 Tax=Caballeronia mineralivorans TaxID=2010198 RepID=UPI0023F4BB55|nr:porin [Caballeronia mineralivorans]MDB5780439.1 porin [Caballeronia mineralivorans]
MKNRWFGWLTLSVSGVLGVASEAATAQSSVSLAGTVDGGIRYQTNASASGGAVTTMNSNGYFSSNKLDFQGVEDLGGGWNAHFLLESGFNLGNGQFDNTTGTEFNRQAFVGVGGNYGSIDMGRQYTIAHDIVGIYDPFHFHFTPLIPLTVASDGTRFNNDVKYKGSYGPFRLEVENAFGGVAGAFSSGASHGIGVNYSSGPFSIGGLVSHRNLLVGNAYQGDDYYMAGIGFKFGALNVSGGFMSEDQANTAATHTVTHNAFGGLSYQISPAWNFIGGYYQTQVSNDKASRRGLSIVSLAYSLSKRTILYGEMDYTKYKNALVTTLNPTGKNSQTAVTVGIDHVF